MAVERTFGGFIGAEPSAPNVTNWPGTLLSSGRSCLTVIAQATGAATFHVPFLICDSVLVPLRKAGVDVRFYRVDEQAQPVLADIPDDGAPVLAMDLYGVRPDGERRLIEAFGTRVVLDRTHALNTPVPTGHWAFCSVRKWFGVADGAWLQGPVPIEPPTERNERYTVDHLLLAVCGRDGEALEAYRRNNALMDVVPLRPSLVSERLLERTDQARAQEARIANFNRLHELLGSGNRLVLDPTRTGPICYPYRPPTPIPLAQVHAAGIFAPRYWPDVLQRPDTDERYTTERALVEEVIALPVDQRYTTADMHEMVGRLNNLPARRSTGRARP